MTIFGDYARYYDVLYQDKDYAGEADFVLSCLVRRQGEPRSEIELAKEKLERLRRQKRGLMQQLLTGKKRVKY